MHDLALIALAGCFGGLLLTLGDWASVWLRARYPEVDDEEEWR
jgi:hypothetical protein